MKELELHQITNARTANAFFFGNILNQQQSSKRSFEGPFILEQRIGSIEPAFLIKQPFDLVLEKMQSKPVIHPMAKTMTNNLLGTCEILVQEYDGDARNIWNDRDELEILKRLQEFPGIGLHKAQVALYLLGEYLYQDNDWDIRKANIEILCHGLTASRVFVV